jgi:O-acetyl-ADP-ribose deacetylase (regulator of RNase III)
LLRTHGPFEVLKPLFTNAGQLYPRGKQILHVAVSDINKAPYDTDALLAETTLNHAFYNCLSEADRHRDVQSVAIPLLGVRPDQFDPWTATHSAAKAVVASDKDTAATPGTLRTIAFFRLTLTVADILHVVFRLVLQGNTEVQTETHVDQPQVKPKSQATQQSEV